MLLVIDCGNTNVVFAVRDGATWRGTWRIRTEAHDRDTIYACYILDAAGRLLGAVSLRDLIMVEPSRHLLSDSDRR